MNERIRRLATRTHLRALLENPKKATPAGQTLCVLDTNVLLDLFFWKDAASKALYDMLERGQLLAVYCEATLEEFIDVLSRKTFALEIPQQDALLDKAVSYGMIWKESVPSCGIRCKDTDDVKFIDLAAASQASYLFSKDKRVLKCGKRLQAKTGTRILTPQAFTPLSY